MAKITNTNIDFTEKKVSEQEGFVTSKKLVKVETGRRHAIKINDVTLERNVYKSPSVIKTGNLITGKAAKSIAVFCNEYIPEHFKKEDVYVKYVFTINGEDIEVVPINSHRNGIKRIKTSDYDLDSDYIEYINQPITSAYLTITITTPNQYESPFISNLKVMIGGQDV